MKKNTVFLSLFFTIFTSCAAFTQTVTGKATGQATMQVYQLASYLLEKPIYQSGREWRPVTCMEWNNADHFSFTGSAASSSGQQNSQAADVSRRMQGISLSGGGSDKEPPPPPTSAGKTSENKGADLYMDLIVKFDDMLKKMGDLISRKDIKLILVFDLDSTLYEEPDKLGFKNIGTIDVDSRVELQFRWFLSFASFLREYESSILLIYNTSRSLLGYGVTTASYGWVDIREPLPRMGEVLTCRLPYGGFSTPPMISFKFFSSDCSSYDGLGIPVPDVIIAETGRTIQWNARHEGVVSVVKVDQIARGLNHWHRETMDEIERLYQLDFSPKTNLKLSDGMRATFRQLNAGSGDDRLLASTVLQQFYSFDRYSVIHLRIKRSCIGNEYVSGNSYYYSSIVNKGSTLSLVVDLLLPVLQRDGTPKTNIWEIIAGDDYADLPMLLPKLEAAAFSDKVRPEMLQRRKDEFEKLGQTYDYTTAPLWKFSLVSSKEYFASRSSRYVNEQLNHPRVIDVHMRGLFGIVEEILKKMEE